MNTRTFTALTLGLLAAGLSTGVAAASVSRVAADSAKVAPNATRQPAALVAAAPTGTPQAVPVRPPVRPPTRS